MDWYSSPQYRAHRLIFDRFCAGKFRQAFNDAVSRLSVKIPIRKTIREQLVRELFDYQRTLLALAVDADLDLFAFKDKKTHKSFLYQNLPDTAFIRYFEIAGNPDAVKQFAPKGPVFRKQCRTAYNYYIDKILWGNDLKLQVPAKKGKKRFGRKGATTTKIITKEARITQFKSRNPHVEPLLSRSLENFTGNITNCLKRINDDRKYIKQCFLKNSKINSIAAITSTGSDSHKGGGQVLIVTLVHDLETTKKKKEKETKIVYKPGDVEIDYRFVGANTPAINALFERNANNGMFPKPSKSLFELLNDEIFKPVNERLSRSRAKVDRPIVQERLTFPTYVILPRNPGSRLKSANGRIPIRESYGYIEYLPHEPTLPLISSEDAVLREVQKLTAPKVQSADWITTSMLDVECLYRMWGRLSVIAALFLQTDLHFQNRRLRAKRLHLIDLENCLVKPIQTINVTGITDGIQKLMSGNPGGYRTEFDMFNTKESTRKPVIAISGSGDPLVLNADKLIFKPAGKKRVAQWGNPLNDPHRVAPFLKGTTEAIEVLDASRERLAKWGQEANLADVIVRHVIESTESLTLLRDGIVRDLFRVRPVSRKGFVEQKLTTLREKATYDWLHNPIAPENPQNRPYAVNVMAYNGADLRQLDIPSYHRRVGSLDLLTSRGEAVLFQADQFTYQSTESFGGIDRTKLSENQKAKLSFQHFYPQTGIELLSESLKKKLPGVKSKRDAVLETLIYGPKPKEKGLPRQYGILNQVAVKGMFPKQ